MNAIQPLYLYLNRADDFINALEQFLKVQKRAPSFVALKATTSYNSSQQEIYHVSARFVVPAKQTVAPAGGGVEHVEPPVVVCYDLAGLPDGFEYSKKIREAVHAFNLPLFPGHLTGTEPPLADADRTRAQPQTAS